MYLAITTLAQLIASVESDANPNAVRFEPNYKPNEAAVFSMVTAARCTYPTAKILCAMSWGLYQIMGDNLIHLGLNISPFEYLASEKIQTEFFDAYCEADHLQFTLDDILTDPSKRQVFARLYNGPGDVPGYVARMIQVATANGLVVVQ